MLTREQIDRYVGRSDETYDVIVAGGGPAGIGAALAAAKSGAKTLLLEARAYMGGVATNAFWMPINRLLINGQSRGGVANLLVEKLQSYGPVACLPGKVTAVDGDGFSVHSDFLRLGVLELLEAHGCHYVLHSPVTGVEKQGNRLTGVIATYKTQQRTYKGQVFIDCTGDGDLAYAAGAATQLGRESDGGTMFITLGFTLANTEPERFFSAMGKWSGDHLEPILQQAEADGFTRSPWYSFDETSLPGVISVNNGGLKAAGQLDATKAEDITIAERGGLQVAHDFVRIAHQYQIPGLEACILSRTGASLGVRETRRVMGDYVLTKEDAQLGTRFEDVIARRYGAVDSAGAQENYAMVNGYDFPYRALLAANLESLLIAGRCGSYTHDGLAAGKSMGNMIEIGQAAGVAAALSAQEKLTPRELDYRKVQMQLEAWGVCLK